MITVFSGTNRKDSRSSQVAKGIKAICEKHYSGETNLLDLADVPVSIMDNGYDPEQMSDELIAIQDDKVVPADKWIVVVPEYNGGLPGVFKLFIDAISIRKYKENFLGKHVLIIGVAAGRSGNLRGLDHLTNMLNYLGMNIHPQKMPISGIAALINEAGELDATITKELDELIASFLA